jgi:ParB/RepB/Spo0J family partition protein
MSEQMIPVSAILDPEWNSRLYTESKDEQAETAALAESMKTQGQLQAIRVETTYPDKDGYVLVLGSRRLRAARLLNWTTINAFVAPTTDEPTRVIQNITENVQRKDLTQFEQARACVKLRELGLKAEDVGGRLGFSKQKVSNLAVSYIALQKTPAILDAWRQEHPAATVDFLRELATVKGKTEEETASKVSDAWDARVKLLDKADAILDPEPKDAKKKGKATEKDDPPYKVPIQRYFDLCKAIQKSKIAGGKLVIECLKYAVGEVDSVKGIIEPEESDAA